MTFQLGNKYYDSRGHRWKIVKVLTLNEQSGFSIYWVERHFKKYFAMQFDTSRLAIATDCGWVILYETEQPLREGKL
jgi:hypothetical protein